MGEAQEIKETQVSKDMEEQTERAMILRVGQTVGERRDSFKKRAEDRPISRLRRKEEQRDRPIALQGGVTDSEPLERKRDRQREEEETSCRL